MSLIDKLMEVKSLPINSTKVMEVICKYIYDRCTDDKYLYKEERDQINICVSYKKGHFMYDGNSYYDGNVVMYIENKEKIVYFYIATIDHYARGGHFKFYIYDEYLINALSEFIDAHNHNRNSDYEFLYRKSDFTDLTFEMFLCRPLLCKSARK